MHFEDSFRSKAGSETTDRMELILFRAFSHNIKLNWLRTAVQIRLNISMILPSLLPLLLNRYRQHLNIVNIRS